MTVSVLIELVLLQKCIQSFTNLGHIGWSAHQFESIHKRYVSLCRDNVTSKTVGVVKVCISSSDDALNQLSVVFYIQEFYNLFGNNPGAFARTVGWQH